MHPPVPPCAAAGLPGPAPRPRPGRRSRPWSVAPSPIRSPSTCRGTGVHGPGSDRTRPSPSSRRRPAVQVGSGVVFRFAPGAIVSTSSSARSMASGCPSPASATVTSMNEGAPGVTEDGDAVEAEVGLFELRRCCGGSSRRFQVGNGNVQRPCSRQYAACVSSLRRQAATWLRHKVAVSTTVWSGCPAGLRTPMTWSPIWSRRWASRWDRHPRHGMHPRSANGGRMEAPGP